MTADATGVRDQRGIRDRAAVANNALIRVQRQNNGENVTGLGVEGHPAGVDPGAADAEDGVCDRAEQPR